MVSGQYQERKLGSVLLKVFPREAVLDDIVPNPEQPRLGPKEDAELRKQIEENGGIWEPLLVEPHPHSGEGKLLIIDGERRFENLKILVVNEKKEQFKKVPVLVTEQSLTKQDRLRVWVYIHRQRKEWSAKEKEGVAYKLVKEAGRGTAANILGITVKELDKLVDTYQLSLRMESLKDPDASISYAREIRQLAAKFRTDEIVNAIVKKVNEGLITTSKEIRDLRKALKDEDAKKEFLNDGATIQSVLEKLPATEEKRRLTYGDGIFKDVDSFVRALTSYPYLDIVKVKGNRPLLEKLDECKRVIEEFKKSLS